TAVNRRMNFPARKVPPDGPALMSQEIISCPSCQRKLQVPEALLGQEVQCPTCGASFVAAAGGQVTPSTASPATVPSRELAPPERAGSLLHDDEGEYDGERRRRRRRRGLESRRGGRLLVLGIISLFTLQIVLGPIALVLGTQDLKAIRDGRMDPEGEGLTQAGRICGLIGTIIGALILLLVCLYIAFIIFIVGAAATSG